MHMVQLGWSELTIFEALSNPRHRGGEKVQLIRDQDHRRQYVARLVRTAYRKIAANPPARMKPEVDAVLDRIRDDLERQPEHWHAPKGAALYLTARMCLAVARGANTLELHPGSRRLAELLGMHWSSVAQHLRDLADQSLLVRVQHGGGRWPATWRLQTI